MKCVGCGKEPAPGHMHPWAVLTGTPGVPPEDPAAYTHRPVCPLCHKDPANRVLGPIKGHYFKVERLQRAINGAVHTAKTGNVG